MFLVFSFNFQKKISNEQKVIQSALNDYQKETKLDGQISGETVMFKAVLFLIAGQLHNSFECNLSYIILC